MFFFPRNFLIYQVDPSSAVAVKTGGLSPTDKTLCPFNTEELEMKSAKMIKYFFIILITYIFLKLLQIRLIGHKCSESCKKK